MIFLPSYCCFVFIYQLHGLVSFLISFSHFGHIDGFLCFSPLAGTSLLTLITGWHHATDTYHWLAPRY